MFEIKNNTINRLYKNFLSLMTLQAINYLAPLIIIPYLIRVLGMDLFGHYAFIMAVVMYGVLLSEYGFDLSATKLIALHRDNKSKVDEIFSSVIIIKLLIATLFFIGLISAVLLIEQLYDDMWLYLTGFTIIIGHSLFPVWFFQGIEKMFYITMINAISKTLFLLLTVIFVNESSTLLLVVIFNALSYLVSGTLAFYFATHKFDVDFKFQDGKTLLFYIRDGWYIFTSRIAVSLYQNTNIIILGMMTNNTAVGYYALVDKIVDAAGMLLEPLTRTVYPYLSQKYHLSKAMFYRRNIQLTFLILSIMAPIAIGV